VCGRGCLCDQLSARHRRSNARTAMFPCLRRYLPSRPLARAKGLGVLCAYPIRATACKDCSWRWGDSRAAFSFPGGGWPAASYRVGKIACSRQQGLRRDGSLAPISRRGNSRLAGLRGRSLKLRSPGGDNTGTYGSGTDDRTSGPGGENVMFMELTEGNIEARDRVELSSQSVRPALPWRPKTTGISRTAGSQPQPPTP